MTIKIRRGSKYQLPASARNRELLVTTDTREIFLGNGEDMPLTPVTDLGRVAALLADGVTIVPCG